LDRAVDNRTTDEECCVETIHLATVVPVDVHAGMSGVNFEDRRRQALDKYRTVIESTGFNVEAHVVHGTPYRRINGIAEPVYADLAVVGSRGQSPLENRIIGSTARNLARTTAVPVLVNRIERGTDDPEVLREHLFQRMLFATDFSEPPTGRSMPSRTSVTRPRKPRSFTCGRRKTKASTPMPAHESN
jgi:hypothetical protein